MARASGDGAGAHDDSCLKELKNPCRTWQKIVGQVRHGFLSSLRQESSFGPAPSSEALAIYVSLLRIIRRSLGALPMPPYPPRAPGRVQHLVVVQIIAEFSENPLGSARNHVGGGLFPDIP